MRRFLIALLTCVLVPAAAFAAGTQISGTFKGEDSQGKFVVVKIAADKLTRSTFTWVAPCVEQGATLSGTTTLIGMLQGSSDHMKETYTTPVKGGYKAKHTVSASFTVNGHKLKGAFRLVAVVYASKGVTQTTCSTPKVTFKAQ